MTFPWETQPEPERNVLEDTVRALQRDVAYMMTHTAVRVHSTRPGLCMLVNTARGQTIPPGECIFLDGTTFKFHDVGMPQVGAPEMSVQELVARIWDVAQELGLELQL